MKNTGLAVILLCLLIGVTSSAQNVIQYRSDAVTFEGAQGGIGVIAVDPVDVGQTVIDAPFSADAVTEVTQVLADGNRIEQRTSASIARNSDGATRREQTGLALGALVAPNSPPIVTITDPKSGVHLTLNYDQKIAHRMRPMRNRLEAMAQSRAEWIEGAPRASISARGAAGQAVLAPTPLPPPQSGTFEVMAGSPVIASAPMAAAAWDGSIKNETLEPTTMDGVAVEGTRTVMTIPAGAIGNALPIEIVSERWYSPELKVVVMTRRYDPRFGETVYRLTNIVRAEPSADLFKVPPDFRIEEIKP